VGYSRRQITAQHHGGYQSGLGALVPRLQWPLDSRWARDYQGQL
jgi:hypothetical protein